MTQVFTLNTKFDSNEFNSFLLPTNKTLDYEIPLMVERWRQHLLSRLDPQDQHRVAR